MTGVTEFSPTCIKTLVYSFKKDGSAYIPPSGYTFFYSTAGGTSPVNCNYGSNYCYTHWPGCTSPEYGFYQVTMTATLVDNVSQATTELCMLITSNTTAVISDSPYYTGCISSTPSTPPPVSNTAPTFTGGALSA